MVKIISSIESLPPQRTYGLGLFPSHTHTHTHTHQFPSGCLFRPSIPTSLELSSRFFKKRARGTSVEEEQQLAEAGQGLNSSGLAVEPAVMLKGNAKAGVT